MILSKESTSAANGLELSELTLDDPVPELQATKVKAKINIPKNAAFFIYWYTLM